MFAFFMGKLDKIQVKFIRNWGGGDDDRRVLGLNVVPGWKKRKPEWVDVACFAMRVHVRKQRKGGVDVIDVQGEDNARPMP